MQGIANNAINKLHEEGLSNAINSTTVVAVLIATVVPQRLRPRCRSVAGLRLGVRSTPVMAGVHILVSGLAIMLLGCLEACSGVFLIIRNKKRR